MPNVPILIIYIKLQSSRLEYYHNQYIKRTGKSKNQYQVVAKWIQFSLCYNELEQLHMQVL